jgi:phosphoribosyl 1,2-cyclic phosphodiesterase
MELTFWGVRGTCPVYRPGVSRIGGNTPCASIETARGEWLVIDAGTGIYELGRRLAAAKTRPARVSIFFTHFHLDHVQGLPFFELLHDPGVQFVFYSAAEPGALREHLGRLMGAPFFPVAFEKTPAPKDFRKIDGRKIRMGGAAVSACPLNHPQGCVAYKIEEGRAAIVFATDTEHPAEGVDGWLCDFAREADVLVYDATFTPREYLAGRQRWGHSTWREGAKLAAAARVKRLILSHFNGAHGDRTIREIERRTRAAFADSRAAREGMRLTLPSA